MPFYEYECQACHQVIEEMQKISDPPLKKCPHCGKNQLVKLISASAFRLTGSGWYETDFKGDKEKKRNLAGGEKAEAKTESTSEAKDSKSDKADKPKAAEVPAAPKKAPPVVRTAARSAPAPSKAPPKPAAKAKAKVAAKPGKAAAARKK